MTKMEKESLKRTMRGYKHFNNALSPCEGCCYGPCVSFCMKKILGYKGEEVPACVR